MSDTPQVQPDQTIRQICDRCAAEPHTVIEVSRQFFARPTRRSRCRFYPRNHSGTCQTHLHPTRKAAEAAWIRREGCER